MSKRRKYVVTYHLVSVVKVCLCCWPVACVAPLVCSVSVSVSLSLSFSFSFSLSLSLSLSPPSPSPSSSSPPLPSPPPPPPSSSLLLPPSDCCLPVMARTTNFVWYGSILTTCRWEGGGSGRLAGGLSAPRPSSFLSFL